MDLFDRLFMPNGFWVSLAERELSKRDIRAIIVHKDGALAVNRHPWHEDRRLGVHAHEVAAAVRQAQQRGVPVIRKDLAIPPVDRRYRSVRSY